MSATNDTQKAEDFDFVEATKDSKKGKEKEEETPETMMNKLKGKLGSKAKEVKQLKKQIATSGSLTPAMIKEARELAEKGLDVDKFMLKHKLFTFDIEQTLHAPLKKDGSFA